MQRVLTDVLRELAPASLIQVFSAYGVSLREQAVPDRFESISTNEAVAAGVVGFSGPSFRGTLIMAAPFELIAATRPVRARAEPLARNVSSDWILVRDWVGELANQVLGRIKNRLLTYGVTFEVSPPAALSGSALVFAAPKGPSPRVHTFVADARKVWFCFDSIYDSGRTVLLDANVESGASEGNLIEF